MKQLLLYYSLAAEKISYLRSPFLLAVRLYWGGQFAQTGWGKMHRIGKITSFFMSMALSYPPSTPIWYRAWNSSVVCSLWLVSYAASRACCQHSTCSSLSGQPIMKSWFQFCPILESFMSLIPTPFSLNP